MGRPSKRSLKKREAIIKCRENENFCLEELNKDKLRKRLYIASEDLVAKNQRKAINLKCSVKRLQKPDVKKANQISNQKNMAKRYQIPELKTKILNSVLERLKDPAVKQANLVAS